MKTPRPSVCALALPLLLVACGPPHGDLSLLLDQEESQSIINGEACDAWELPSAVAIIIDAEISILGMSQAIRTPICTGTLIAPDTVMAAAHCFDPEALTMGMGEVLEEAYYASFAADLAQLSEGSSTDLPDDAIEATAWVMHPDFDLSSMQGVDGPGEFKDVAVMFLEQSVEHVAPAVVIAPGEVDQLVAGKAVEIAGWGQQTQTSGPFDPPPPGTVGVKHCAQSSINEIGAYEMQIGGDASTSRKCHGDSGGPSYMDVDTPHDRWERVVGITSHSYDDTDCAKGGIDTRVDVWLEWIDAEMSAACADGIRAWCDEPGVIPPSYYDGRPMPDAGPRPDVDIPLLDASTPRPDAGVVEPDAGVTPPDAAQLDTTAGDRGGAGRDDTNDGNETHTAQGCICAGPPSPALRPSWVLATLLLGVLAVRRRGSSPR